MVSLESHRSNKHYKQILRLGFELCRELAIQIEQPGWSLKIRSCSRRSVIAGVTKIFSPTRRATRPGFRESVKCGGSLTQTEMLRPYVLRDWDNASILHSGGSASETSGDKMPGNVRFIKFRTIV